MKYFFTRAGRLALMRLQAKNSLIGLDFDGTLSPIVTRAHHAKLPAGTLDLLQCIHRLAPIAIVSGRSRRDLAPRLGFRPRYVIGNHGLEAPWNTTGEKRAAQTVRAWIEQMDWSRFEHDRGISLENKTYSLSLHYRRAKHPVVAARELMKAARKLSPAPRLIPGKYVINLTAPRTPDKGGAMVKAMAHAKRRTAIFVGDDDTDEDVFRLEHPSIIGVRVGRRADSKAEFYLKNQSEVPRLLREIVLTLS